MNEQAWLFGRPPLLPEDYTVPTGPLVVSYGGGVNSLAMVIGYAERGIRPGAIVFSDTRGEKPKTYAYIEEHLKPWLVKAGFPELTIVSRPDFGRSKTGDTSLENECLRLGTLPSRAYGFGTCADKWKIDPFKYWAQDWEPARLAWAAGQVVVRAIGYDAGEVRRVERIVDDGYGKVYPLLEWDWDREACIEAIERVGLPVPPKSACFYCPSSTKQEVLALAAEEPALFQRAVALERRALDTGRWNVEGLGRRFSWAKLVACSEREREAFPEAPVEACTICEVGE